MCDISYDHQKNWSERSSGRQAVSKKQERKDWVRSVYYNK